MLNNNIFIVGPAGSGKTTVGKKLSSLRNLSFYDVDEVIAERAGVNLAWILDREGLEGFNKRQEKIIAELSEKERVVVATGASAVESSFNCNNMGKRGIVVYLDPAVDGSPENNIFSEAADIVIRTCNKNIKTIIDEILAQIKF